MLVSSIYEKNEDMELVTIVARGIKNMEWRYHFVFSEHGL
jgi:hypothetical protein